MRQRTYIDSPFPVKGLVETTAKRDQPEGTTIGVRNMRAFSPSSGRARGAQRAGLLKHCSVVVNGANRVQDISQITSVQASTDALTSLQVRSIKLLAVSNGTIRIITATASTAPASGSNTLSTTAPVIFSAPLFGVMYYTDGTSAPCKYTSSTDTLANWTASAGTFPINGSDYPRLIDLWRGRIVMSGIKSDPHNWFMSAVGDATNFDYALVPEVETQAVAGNSSVLGKVGDVVMSIVPYNDDLLLFGCDHEIWQVTGDPMSGGRLDRLSGITGMSWGRPWCMSPEGLIYFFGSRGGVYRMVPNEAPVRITASSIDERLSSIDLNTHIVRMAWDDEDIGVHVFVTSLVNNVTDNYYYDVRNESWWVDGFDNSAHSPVAVHVFDGDDPGDRAVLLGGQDGYIRKFSEAARDDDGTAIDSHVIFGPIEVAGGDVPYVFAELQAVLASESSDVDWEIGFGNSAEDVEFQSGGHILQENGGLILLEDGTGALLLEDTNAVDNPTGTLSPTRSVVRSPRVRGFSSYVKLGNDTLDETWEMERLRCALSSIPTSKRRRL